VSKFIDDLNNMFTGEAVIDMQQRFDHSYPLVFLNMLLFCEQETQTIRYVEDVEFADLVRPQR
jgi:hypothetical protein